MSALAQLLLEQGYWVSGSDINRSKKTVHLEAFGAMIFIGHDARNVHDVDMVVYSSCINPDNPEMIAARDRNIHIIPRGLLLSYLMQEKQGIAVCGAHGKTTTTAMIALILKRAGRNPSFAVGADVKSLGGNAEHGMGEFFIAEADESDGSFLYLNPKHAIVTNIDKEHLDYYTDMDHIINTYKSFFANIDKSGMLVYFAQDNYIKKALDQAPIKRISYGLNDSADVYADEVDLFDFKSEFKCVYFGNDLGKFQLAVPGEHNILNAMAVITLAMELGVDLKVIKAALYEFQGANRRFQIKSTEAGIVIVDDYAHHPTEIKATLKAAKAAKHKRVVSVFQPHRFSRTKFLQREFGECFNDADIVIITDIYAASETPIDGIAAKTIFEEVKANKHKNVFLIGRERLTEELHQITKPGDLLLMLGAGDIAKLSSDIAKSFSEKSGVTKTRIFSEEEFEQKMQDIFKGEIEKNEPLSRHTSFKIGGAAKYLLTPIDSDDLSGTIEFLNNNGLGFRVIGKGSNLLVSDSKIPHAVIKLDSKYFKRIEKFGNVVYAAAGATLAGFCNFTHANGLSGCEFLTGIPGTIGGALIMNAGVRSITPAFGGKYRSIANIVIKITIMDYDGKTSIISAKEADFAYRSSQLKDKIILGAWFELKPSGKDDIIKNTRDFWDKRAFNQDYSLPNAGCVFKNPKDINLSAGALIERCGFKGFRIGDAEVSTKHANFILNKGRATSSDVKQIIIMVQKKVNDEFGVTLEPEVEIWE